MRPRAASGWLVALASLAAPPAGATPFERLGAGLERPGPVVALDGGLRVRGELLHNLDLDRGLTPSGRPLFPVPLSDPSAQALSQADLRLRTDLTLRHPGAGVGVKLRVDVLDAVGFGSTAAGLPAAAATQSPPPEAFVLKRAWGEALTPVGVLAAGRMGSHWGLGLLANDGDCADCDGGDAADRVAFVTPLVGHLWALAFDWSASGPQVPRPDGHRVLDLDPADDVRSLTAALLRVRSDAARRRRRRAGRTTVEYGAFVSRRWQDQDVPAAYVDLAEPGSAPVSPTGSMRRGLSALALDGWLRVTTPCVRVEAEVAVLHGEIEQTSLLPGLLLRGPTTSDQLGAALETDFGAPEDTLVAGVDAGYASGDASPGFGAFPELGPQRPAAGELDGLQTVPPFDATVDNFRFHPDYRIDRIVFREVVGTVTDALYLRPHVRWLVAPFGAGRLTLSLAVVAAWAIEASSTPGGDRALGVEVDPTLAYTSDDGLSLAAEYAALLPLAGFDNPQAGLDARPAQLARLRLGYAF